ncbi:unnamed protein product, partial [Ectocarpus sp. 12 AP-2014]
TGQSHIIYTLQRYHSWAAALPRALGAVYSRIIMTGPQGTAGNPTTAVPAAATHPDIETLLCTHPVHSCWRQQEEVEISLGLEKNAISGCFQGLGGRGRGATKGKMTQDRLKKAGVFRRLGTTTPRRVWWLAFRGKGATRPRFEDRG